MRRSYPVNKYLEMSLKQQALHLAALGLLLRLNLVERELEGATGRQPVLQQSEFVGRRSGDDGGGGTRQFPDGKWRWVARRKWSCDICY